MTSHSWHARSPDRYVTKGAELIRHPEGWCARAGRRARGPISNLDAAMKAGDELIERALREAA